MSNGQVTPPLQHRQFRPVEYDGRPADGVGREACREERPLRQIGTTSPLQRPFASSCVVVLLIENVETAP